MPNLSVILVSPQGDANIGASARAMKNFGFHDLRLVDPVDYMTRAAYTWAVDARDVLNDATTYDSLDAALHDISYAAAFTRRLGRQRRRHMTLSEAASRVAALGDRGRAAIIFGPEDSGLSNEQIGHADAIISIPTSADLPSLNLAQAVLLACYEIYRRLNKTIDKGESTSWRFASREEFLPVLKKLDNALSALRYENTKTGPLKSKILNQFEKLFGRAGLTGRDIRMFEGLLARIEKMIDL